MKTFHAQSHGTRLTIQKHQEMYRIAVAGKDRFGHVSPVRGHPDAYAVHVYEPDLSCVYSGEGWSLVKGLAKAARVITEEFC